MSSSSEKIGLSAKVLVFGKYSGRVRFSDDDRFGIELDAVPMGKDGKLDGKPCFKCRDGFGVFPIKKFVQIYSRHQQAACEIQARFRGVRTRKKTRPMFLQKAWNTLDSDAENIALERGRKTFEVAEEALEKRRESYMSDVEIEDFEKLEIEESYDGPHISIPPTLKDVIALLKCFKAGGTLHLKYAMQIIHAVTKIYEDQPTVQMLPLPEGKKMTIVGDLHGQLQDLFTIFTINGLPSPANQYFFNGDFVDRGYYGVEIVLTIFAFKLLYPDAVHMNRGNHECRQQNAYMGFEDEVLYKYDGTDLGDTNRAWRIYDAFHEAFQALPLAATLGGKVAIFHGGLFGKRQITFKHINAIQRKREPPLEGTSLQDQLFEQILWSDPRPTQHFPVQVRWWKPSDRGAGVEFGVEMTNQFCRRNKVALIIRSHECVQDGYEVLHGGRLITIFSASHYCQKNNNKGAFITFTHKMEPEIQQFVAHQISDFNISSFEEGAKVEVSKKDDSSESKTGDDTTKKSNNTTDTKESRTEQEERMMKDTIRMISERIIVGKVDLYWWYMQCEQAGDGCVSVVNWAEGLHDCLGLDLPFLSYRDHLVKVQEDGSVNYVRFLKSHRIVHADNTWQRSLINMICKRLYKHCQTFKAAYDFLDKDNDGYIQFDELASTLEALKLGLKRDQVMELMQSLDVSDDNKVDFEEFKKLFQVEFTLVMKQQYQEEFRDMLHKIGELLFERPGVKKKENLSTRPSRSASSTFREIAGNAVTKEVSFDEFASGMRRLLGEQSPSKTDLVKLAAVIDTGGNGKIDMDEFIEAFKVKTKSEAFEANLLNDITTVLYQHKQALLQIFRRLDTKNSGHVTSEDFMKGVQMINMTLTNQISDHQIEYLINTLDPKSEGNVDYQNFLNAFSVVSPKHHTEEKDTFFGDTDGSSK